MELRGGFIGCVPGRMFVDPGNVGPALDGQIVLRWRFLSVHVFSDVSREPWQAMKYSVRREGVLRSHHRRPGERRTTNEFKAPFIPPRRRVLAARCARVIESEPPSKNNEGAGKAGCPPHPWSACNKKHAVEPQVQADPRRLPCAMVLRLIRALPGDHAWLPPSPVDRIHELSACIGAPEPHDFAVRSDIARRIDITASIASRPTFVTTRTPLLPRRDTKLIMLILANREAKYFSR
jgi:hypothetical protein